MLTDVSRCRFYVNLFVKYSTYNTQQTVRVCKRNVFRRSVGKHGHPISWEGVVSGESRISQREEAAPTPDFGAKTYYMARFLPKIA